MSLRKFFFLTALVVGLCIHSSTAFAESPEKVAVKFAKAYYMLDASMEEYLCEACKTNEDEEKIVGLYLEKAGIKARNRGYAKSFLQMSIGDIDTEILNMNDSSAKVKITAVKTRNINPLYKVVGAVFNLINEYEVDEIINLVNKDGEWEIGPGAFDLPM
ncbi:MAG: hypothetical protein K8S13_17020 [Desulfobacula sp.]|uniref:hypothetical protein n=1 Tax=Desulfobacula sp. TaxID=2593537 RepID=UPI0025BCFBDA|nr:hypothetical protein [Desulfobacula sp.]MCD4721542.1 hypothetical protein [Desulfobacula sp.]